MGEGRVSVSLGWVLILLIRWSICAWMDMFCVSTLTLCRVVSRDRVVVSRVRASRAGRGVRECKEWRRDSRDKIVEWRVLLVDWRDKCSDKAVDRSE